MSVPNFMCIGAAKAGTTTLYNILRQHPDIFIPNFKEPHFFDIPENYNNGLAWYENNYYKKNQYDKKIIADFTPSYFFEANAPKRIYESLGREIKFLVILRNPLDRAYSHFLHSKRNEHEPNSFVESLKTETERLKKYKSKNDYLSSLRHSYIHQSLYAEMLERYLQYFDLDNFLFIHFEDEFLLDIKLTVDKILDFLELNKNTSLNINIKSNTSSIARSKVLKRLMNQKGWWREMIKFMIPSKQLRQIINYRMQKINIKEFEPPIIEPQLREKMLEEYFRKDIMKLEVIINRKMHW